MFNVGGNKFRVVAGIAPHALLALLALLAQLMIEHGLSQKDVPEVRPQSLVSAVLAGKRKLNLRQVKSLAKRFHVSMEAFSG